MPLLDSRQLRDDRKWEETEGEWGWKVATRMLFFSFFFYIDDDLIDSKFA